ncbi:glycosyltransferase family 2 protein [Agarivorans sp. MS3-6]|uniref:glycosyltransferase family 2 protein n=1 Tax=Agarivorans sp. TSD2052 TaxID=2937286 RepID=UPI00200C8BDD|nr:glycosyltransferase family 2 protein [Agarivorans sp. TSD2052]UPW20095.1 glycosyltransferase family 2 protein [Agarivorans sp. TSD2052]
MLVDVVIVNWNSKDLLKSCVDSVLQHSHKLLGQLVVVDNASSDTSIDFLSAYPSVTLSALSSNVGFAKACNLGASLGDSDYVLFLNPDAALDADTLSQVSQFMNASENQAIGICGVPLLDEHQQVARSCSRRPTVKGIAAHALGIDRLWPRFGQAMRDWDHNNDAEVDQVIGAFYYVRRTLFQQLKGFDERFFVYYEEVDFAKRAADLGYKSYFLSKTHAFHVGGGTSRQVKGLRMFYSIRSRLLYCFKHFGRFTAVAVALLSLVIEPLLRMLQSLLRRDMDGCKELLLAYSKLWKWAIFREQGK